jgi:hypothetical protein
MRRLLAVTLLLFAIPARAEPPCKGTLSGKVTATFDCDAAVVTSPAGKPAFLIQPRAPIDGVPAFAPGAFELEGPPRPGTYTLDDLGMGKASVAAEGGVFYSATKTTSQRGEVTLVLRSVQKDPKVKGAWIVHGTYRARLPPAGAGKQGEVVVEVKF